MDMADPMEVVMDLSPMSRQRGDWSGCEVMRWLTVLLNIGNHEGCNCECAQQERSGESVQRGRGGG
jgi:hypothetical protein